MSTPKTRRGKEITLPSGDTVVVRGVGFDALLLSERVPDLLTPLVIKACNGEQAALPAIKDTDEEAKRQTMEMIRFYNLVCELAFVSPRIVANPQADDEISITDLDQVDKQYVCGAVLGTPTAWIKSFRAEQAQDVPAVGDGKGLSHPTEPVGEAEATPEAG